MASQKKESIICLRLGYKNLSLTITFLGLQIYGGPRSLSHDFKKGPITFQGSGPSGPIFFSCEKISLFFKYSSYRESTNSTEQKVHEGSQYSKTCLKQPLKKRQNKDLNNKW